MHTVARPDLSSPWPGVARPERRRQAYTLDGLPALWDEEASEPLSEQAMMNDLGLMDNNLLTACRICLAMDEFCVKGT